MQYFFTSRRDRTGKSIWREGEKPDTNWLMVTEGKMQVWSLPKSIEVKNLNRELKGAVRYDLRTVVMVCLSKEEKMVKTETERFQNYIEKLLAKAESRSKKRALSKLNNGKMPKRSAAKKLVKTNEYQVMLEKTGKELHVPRYREALSDKSVFQELYAQYKSTAQYLAYCKKHELPEERIDRLQQEAENDEKMGEVIRYICSLDLDARLESIVEELEEEAAWEVKNYFLNARLAYGKWKEARSGSGKYKSAFLITEEITADNIEEYLDSLFETDHVLDEFVVRACTGKDYDEWNHLIIESFQKEDPYLAEKKQFFPEYYMKAILENEEYGSRIFYAAQTAFSKKDIWKMLGKNPYLSGVFRELRYREHRKRAVGSAIVDRIPEKVIDLYPQARELKRHFILHIGGTNSGKTYQALEALKEASSGVYLAPLRLLAYEVYEKLNIEGYPCSLLTGEESSPIEGAIFTASTVEMADYNKRYAVAVIDEAQMVEDEERGGGWTSAILGILADTVHICASENADQILIRMIEECGETYEIVRHERKTPLLIDENSFQFPGGVQKGDALIVFSRKNVHAVAAELQGKGYKCAIIYGALPYDVRHRQAELFASGKMDVVVATDAIGMGMNLPIRRVVFLEQKKFDGKNSRFLRSDEVKQIAGRAGRLGLYEEGFVTSLGGKKAIRGKLSEPDKKIKKAVLGFPKALLGIDAKLSDIIHQWTQIEIQQGYRRAVTEREYGLCLELEKWCDDKYFIYSCITIAYDEGNTELHQIWLEMCRAEWEGSTYPVSKMIPRQMTTDLKTLEQDYHICDLLYAYCDRFNCPQYISDIQDAKEKIAERIQRELEKEKLQQRVCRRCGAKLPWNYPYGVCTECFEAWSQRSH